MPNTVSAIVIILWVIGPLFVIAGFLYAIPAAQDAIRKGEVPPAVTFFGWPTSTAINAVLKRRRQEGDRIAQVYYVVQIIIFVLFSMLFVSLLVKNF